MLDHEIYFFECESAVLHGNHVTYISPTSDTIVCGQLEYFFVDRHVLYTYRLALDRYLQYFLRVHDLGTKIERHHVLFVMQVTNMSHFVRSAEGLREQPIEVQLYCPAEKEYISMDLVTAYKIHTQCINSFERLDVYRLRFEDQYSRPHTIMLYAVTDCNGQEYCLFRDETNDREYHLA